jgi:hypothetical protein
MSENAPDGGNTGTEGTEGGGGNAGVSTFTQEQVSAIAAREAKAAKAKAQADLLATLGVESVDDLKGALDGFKQFQDSQKSAEQKAAELASQVDTFKQQAQSASTALKAVLDAELASVPEDKRSIVPDFGDPAKTLAWLTQNRAILGGGGQTAPVVNVGTGNSPAAQGAQSTVTLEQFSKMNPAERMQFYADFPEQAADMSAKFAATVAT